MKWFGIGVSFVLLSFGHVFAQGKIGYVNSQKIFAESPEFQEAQTRFDKEVVDWNTRAESMNQEVDSVKAEQSKNALIWSGSKRQEVEALLKAKQDSLQLYLNETFGPNGKAENRMAELSRPIEERIIAIIRRVAIEKDFDMVFDVATVSIAFGKESLDLTDEVLAEMAKER
ncbi:MAG: OmpH family outer membrane protein [candidate division Zixibacteria bacterium]